MAMIEAMANGSEAPDGSAAGGRTTPQINAKGLGRDGAAKPMIYSAPELGSETPSVQLAKADGGAESNTAKRQQARSNPNRGSRGNKGGSKAGKRKR
jgi:preprotein translocase subunit SecA